MNSEELNREFVAVKDSAYRYAITLLRDRHAAEDAVQDLYERLWRLRIFIRMTGFRSLVMTGMRNLCIDRIRTRRRSVPKVDITAAERSIETHTYDTVERSETCALARHLVETLPPRESEVMHLRDIEGLDIETIAEMTGSTEQSVRMALSRARSRVKEELLKIMNHGL